MKIENLGKKKVRTLITGIIVILLGIILFIGEYSHYHKLLENPVDFKNVTIDEYGKVDVNIMTDYIAEADEENSEKIYYIYDDDNIYLASLNDEALEDLKDIFDYSYDENADFPGSVTISGTAVPIPDDLKEIAMDSLNEMYGEEIVTEDNFEHIVGSYYLDTNLDPVNQNLPWVVLLSLFIVIAGVVAVVNYFKQNRYTKEILEKYQGSLDKIEEEIKKDSVITYPKQKIYLTDSYLITYSAGLDIIEYKDVIWVYYQDVRYRGNTTRTIYVVTKENKVHATLAINLTKKNKIIIEEIYQAILLKVPDVLEGNTPENKKKVKELN